MSAELVSHRRQQLVLEVRFAARTEALIERGGQHRHRAPPSSIAALIVQRPSPESETRPENSASSGSLTSDAAVKSSSHDATTLPRRHTSAMSRRSKSY